MSEYTLIALGSNLPVSTYGPRQVLEKSLELFAHESLAIVAQSNWYASPAFPPGSGPDFVNGVVAVRTVLDPAACIAALHRIEARAGRVRRTRWEPRVCDLDLIAMGDVVLPDRDTFDTWKNLGPEAQKSTVPDQLILPHPRIQDRVFVLYPLRDVAPDWVHPVSGLTAGQMLQSLPEQALGEIGRIT